MTAHHPAPLAQLRTVNEAAWRHLCYEDAPARNVNGGTDPETQARAADLLGAHDLAATIRRDGLAAWFTGRPWPDLNTANGTADATAQARAEVTATALTATELDPAYDALIYDTTDDVLADLVGEDETNNLHVVEYAQRVAGRSGEYVPQDYADAAALADDADDRRAAGIIRTLGWMHAVTGIEPRG